MAQSRIRNFCIVAHIDHGKSTLADRLIEATGTLEKRQMREQVLDTMDLERERGITIKLNAVRMRYKARDGASYELNLIDTPGHVDFTYEVSRSLAACEGAILVVDASQGVQAQTLSNLFLAMDAGLEIIPVLNKIDLPGAEPERRAQEVIDLIGARRDEILAVSAKEGTGMPELLEAIVARVPPPRGDDGCAAPGAHFRFLLRPVPRRDPEGPGGGRRGARGHGDRVRLPSGRRLPRGRSRLSPRSASTRADARGRGGGLHRGQPARREGRPGGRHRPRRRTTAPPSCCRGTATSSRWSSPGIYPTDSDQYEACATRWRSCCSTTPSLHYEPESSTALGFGFRCGFLGLLHMEIVQERLEREFNLDLSPRCRRWSTTSTAPTARCCCWRIRATCPTPPASTGSMSPT